MMKSQLLRFFQIIRSFIPLLLSHHPECQKFKDHTLKVGKVRLCIGCFVGYPSTFIGIYVLFLINLIFIISSQFLIIIGIILISAFFLGPIGLITKKTQKIFQKIIIGFGVAFLFWGIYFLPYTPFIRTLSIFFIFGGILSILNFYHGYNFLIKCYHCQVPFNWGRCSGFTSIHKNFEKFGLNNILLWFDNYSKSIKFRREKKNSIILNKS